MGAMRVTAGAAALAAAVGSAVCVGQVATFVILPPGPGHNYVRPRGISGDGTTVFGETGLLLSGSNEAYRWTAATGGQNVGSLVAGPFSVAYASNLTGTSIYGEGDDSDGFRWDAPGAVTVLSGGPVLDVSADGAVRLTRTAVIDGGGSTPLAPLPGDQTAAGVAISASGAAVALDSHFFQSGGSGYGYGGGEPDIVRDQACRWTAADGAVGCGFLPGTDRSFATSISEDGAVVIGTCRPGSGLHRGFRWTAAAGMSELAPIAGQATPVSVEPVDCSADGSVVVCRADGEAVVWTEEGGFRSIKQILLGNGWDVGAWTFYAIAGVSDDGSVVTGQAVDGSGSIHGWVAPLVQSCSGPASPWSATRRVIVADGDALPGGDVAGQVSEVAVSTPGAVLLRSGGDLWFAPAGGGALSLALEEGTGGISVGTASINDAGIIAAARRSFISVGSPLPVQEVAHSVLVGPPGAMVVVAAHGDAAPADTGGGALRTYGSFFGPLMSNGGLAVFQTGVDGGSTGGVRCLAHNTLTGGPLVRSAPAVSIDAPMLQAVSDSGVVVRTATQGVLAGGPPPAEQALIAPTGGAAPGFGGGTYSSFSSVGVNGAGTVVFIATVTAPGGPRDALYTCAPGGTPQLIATAGTAVGGVTLTGISSAKIASTGSVFFIASLSDERSGIVKAKPGGSFVLAAADGDPAPGSGPCRTLGDWNLVGVDGRRLLLSASAGGPSSISQVLATWGEEEGLSLIARTGETVTPRPGLTGIVASALPSVLGGNGQDGGPHAMRGNHLVYTMVLSTPGGQVRAVIGEELPPLACGGSDVGSQGGEAGPDGLLNNNDFVAFIDLFFNQSPVADVGVQGGLPGNDAHWDNNDFVVFIDRFFAGCA